jgi:hypothetical protein
MSEKPEAEALPPKCGFIERPDGELVWGSKWQPGPYADPEPIAVEYQQNRAGAWVPHQAWVKDVRRGHEYIDMHDCDWVESESTLYHHNAGGGDPYVNAYAQAERLPGRIWIAAEVTVHHAGERERGPLSDADMLAMGLKRVHGPTPAPFAEADEDDTFYCETCDDRVPDERGGKCSCCDEDCHMHKGDLIVVVDEDEAGIEAAGVYRAVRWPFYMPGLCGSGWLYEDSLRRVADVPHDVDLDGYAAGPLCRSCSTQILADRELPALAHEWTADPEAMPDEHREALLDAVRERVDKWIAGYPERRVTEVHTWFCKKFAPCFDVTIYEMQVLCDEAGYP